MSWTWLEVLIIERSSPKQPVWSKTSWLTGSRCCWWELTFGLTVVASCYFFSLSESGSFRVRNGIAFSLCPPAATWLWVCRPVGDTIIILFLKVGGSSWLEYPVVCTMGGRAYRTDWVSFFFSLRRWSHSLAEIVIKLRSSWSRNCEIAVGPFY